MRDAEVIVEGVQAVENFLEIDGVVRHYGIHRGGNRRDFIRVRRYRRFIV